MQGSQSSTYNHLWPPGGRKTAAARLVLSEACANMLSPFKEKAKFIEIDATICRFDERNILIRLVRFMTRFIREPVPWEVLVFPQPKPRCVYPCPWWYIVHRREIGELHPLQMNKLLKVLEDRKVLLESAY